MPGGAITIIYPDGLTMQHIFAGELLRRVSIVSSALLAHAQPRSASSWSDG